MILTPNVTHKMVCGSVVDGVVVLTPNQVGTALSSIARASVEKDLLTGLYDVAAGPGVRADVEVRRAAGWYIVINDIGPRSGAGIAVGPAIPPMTIPPMTITVPPMTITIPSMTTPPMTIFSIVIPPIVIPPIVIPPIVIPPIVIPPITIPPVDVPPAAVPPAVPPADVPAAVPPADVPAAVPPADVPSRT